ncbi:hypothetical protein CC1G_09450 [Coprinopsis cinerea okayama7|uniref:Uncharacterized protein n=1 Tax=Coprinopsis cinerea (strain Okayama-7 / 130 / ATCC MYA-4618 / FGSC 9003) TaxID=240176 RepID=A8PDB5_COPC7|nr:hypothetical protein CC1G_09450 [Coprinopsis cinerea okayama7\|eukprot:XP_001840566.2 hypothetical protein CC1G_09450 [Coprinopsis cinerea okayama7\
MVQEGDKKGKEGDKKGKGEDKKGKEGDRRAKGEDKKAKGEDKKAKGEENKMRDTEKSAKKGQKKGSPIPAPPTQPSTSKKRPAPSSDEEGETLKQTTKSPAPHRPDSPMDIDRPTLTLPKPRDHESLSNSDNEGNTDDNAIPPLDPLCSQTTPSKDLRADIVRLVQSHKTQTLLLNETHSNYRALVEVSDKTNAINAQLRERLEKTEGEYDDLRGRVSKVEDANSWLKDENKELRQENKTLRTQLDDLKRRFATIDELQKNVSTLTERLDCMLPPKDGSPPTVPPPQQPSCNHHSSPPQPLHTNPPGNGSQTNHAPTPQLQVTRLPDLPPQGPPQVQPTPPPQILPQNSSQSGDLTGQPTPPQQIVPQSSSHPPQGPPQGPPQVQPTPPPQILPQNSSQSGSTGLTGPTSQYAPQNVPNAGFMSQTTAPLPPHPPPSNPWGQGLSPSSYADAPIDLRTMSISQHRPQGRAEQSNDELGQFSEEDYAMFNEFVREHHMMMQSGSGSEISSMSSHNASHTPSNESHFGES